MRCRFILLVSLIFLFFGCASNPPNQEIQYGQLMENELAETKIIGSVQANFTLFEVKKKMPSVESVKYTANQRLRDEAKRSYAEPIDIKNVNVSLISMQTKNVSRRLVYEYSYIANATVITSNLDENNETQQ